MSYKELSELVSEQMYKHYKENYSYIIDDIEELKKRGETKKAIQNFINKKFGKLNQTALTLNSAIEYIFKTKNK